MKTPEEWAETFTPRMEAARRLSEEIEILFDMACAIQAEQQTEIEKAREDAKTWEMNHESALQELGWLRARWENLCDGISYPTLDDERLRYVEVQIPRDDWDEIKVTKERGEGE